MFTSAPPPVGIVSVEGIEGIEVIEVAATVAAALNCSRRLSDSQKSSTAMKTTAASAATPSSISFWMIRAKNAVAGLREAFAGLPRPFRRPLDLFAGLLTFSQASGPFRRPH
jgi:hypothetical protein